MSRYTWQEAMKQEIDNKLLVNFYRKVIQARREIEKLLV